MRIQRREVLRAMAATSFMLAHRGLHAATNMAPAGQRGLLTANLSQRPAGSAPVVDVVADLPHKSAYTLNSWFAIGHFESQGQTLNYLVHLFALSIKGFTVAVDTAASITNETTGWYDVHHDFHTVLRADARSDRLLVRTPTSEISGSLDTMRVRARLKGGSIDVNLKAVGHPLYNKGTGRFDMLGMDVFQYSIPTLETAGRIVIDGREFPVSGMSWFDRQWQNQRLGPPVGRWTWMDLNLSNGWRISLWDAVDADGKAIAWVTMVDDAGKHTVADLEPLATSADAHWLSPRSGFRYPTRWRVRVPSLDLQLDVAAGPSDQEVNGLSPRYEGACAVTGFVGAANLSGYCYVEMVGDWKPEADAPAGKVSDWLRVPVLNCASDGPSATEILKTPAEGSFARR